MTGETKANLQSFGANIVVAPRARDVSLTYGGIVGGGVCVGQEAWARPIWRACEASRPRRASPSWHRSSSVAVQVKGRRALLIGVAAAAQFKLKRWWSVETGRPPRNGHEFVAGAAAARSLGLSMGDYVRIEGAASRSPASCATTGSQDDDLLIVDLAAVAAAAPPAG